MLSIFVLLAIIVNISAYYDDYGYGYNGYNHGYKKGINDRYGSDPYLSPNYGQYGDQYGYQWPVQKKFPSYHRRSYVIKILPPIYKNVKQPVIYKQPVIINKIPVIHKKEEVTVKKMRPIYEVEKPTVIKKDVGVDVMHGIDKMPEEVPIKNEYIGYDVMSAVEKGPQVMKGVMGYPEGVLGVDKKHVMNGAEEDVIYELDKRMKGYDGKEIMKEVKDMEVMKEVKDMEVMKEVKDMEVMKEVKDMEVMKDEDFGDYNQKDFETA